MELDLHPGHLAPESLLLTTTLFNTNSQVTLCEVLQCGLITISFSHPTPFVFDLSANPVGSTFRTYPESNLSSPHPLLPPPLLAWTTVVASSLLPPLPPPQVCPHSCQRVLVQPKSAHGPPLLRPLLHLSQRKSQSPPRGQRGPTEPGPITSPTSPPATSPLAHSTLAALTFLLFLTHTKQAPNSGPLHLLAFSSASNSPLPDVKERQG